MGEVPHGVSVLDDEHKEFVERVFQNYPPGCYLIRGSYEERVESYFKTDKSAWLSLFAHDYTIASLRGDEGAKGQLKRVYKGLAEMLDWTEREPWVKYDEKLGDLAWESAETLFKFYLERVKVDGWRVKADEAPWMGEKRGLLYELSPVGDMFRREYGRWMALQMTLDEFEADVRLKDKVALFVSMELNHVVRLHINRVSWRHAYVNYVLGSLLSGSKLDRWVDEAMWWSYKATRRFEELALRPGAKFLGPECLDWAIMAAMTAEGVDPYSEAEPAAYLPSLAQRLGKPELARLYNIASVGSEDGIPPDEYWDGILEDSAFLSEEERRIFKKMFKAGREFLGAMIKTAEDIIERRYGYRVDLGKFEIEKMEA